MERVRVLGLKAQRGQWLTSGCTVRVGPFLPSSLSSSLLLPASPKNSGAYERSRKDNEPTKKTWKSILGEKVRPLLSEINKLVVIWTADN